MSDLASVAADADDTDEDDSEDNNTDDEDDDYGASIATKPYMLNANGDLFDLRDPDQVNTLQEIMKSYRNKLVNGELKTYEGHSIEFGKGGRARMLYDVDRIDLAEGYHEGRHNLSWDDQHEESMKVVRIVAAKNRSLY